jgi:antitoxin PrlF
MELRAVLRANGRLWLPVELCESLGLEPDDLFEVDATPEGILLRPTGEKIDSDQSWFWTPEWQAGERQADAEREAGRSVFFESDEAFLRALEHGLTPEQEARLTRETAPSRRAGPRADV